MIQFNEILHSDFITPFNRPQYDLANKCKTIPSLVDPQLEYLDPNPDIYKIFNQFNKDYFYGTLGGVEVKWSNRMTLCAGLCRYHRSAGSCNVVLSQPLLKLRPRKDLIETLLDRDGHGPEFQSHMYRINKITGTNITIYHDFHREVNSYRVHWWKCDGPCVFKHPFYGIVKRAMNRAPGPNDDWWAQHVLTCGGNFTKLCGPDPKIRKLRNGKRKNIDKNGESNIMVNWIIKPTVPAIDCSSKKSENSFITNSYTNNDIPSNLTPAKNCDIDKLKHFNKNQRPPSIIKLITDYFSPSPTKSHNAQSFNFDIFSPARKKLKFNDQNELSNNNPNTNVYYFDNNKLLRELHKKKISRGASSNSHSHVTTNIVDIITIDSEDD
ncbi:unnamed protein product [Gordionus sp. m RMFG-2023]